jgi:hypothetical protein
MDDIFKQRMEKLRKGLSMDEPNTQAQENHEQDLYCVAPDFATFLPNGKRIVFEGNNLKTRDNDVVDYLLSQFPNIISKGTQDPNELEADKEQG